MDERRNTIAEMLGIDYSDPSQRLARDIIEAEFQLINDLVEHRRASGLTVAQVAERMGVSERAVKKFEALGREHPLTVLSRYAHAIGVMVSHTVTPT